jgi:uncharacterized DUF497 family protein
MLCGCPLQPLDCLGFCLALAVLIFFTTIFVRLTFDANKRARTLTERGLDFARALELFAGATVTSIDSRMDYGEPRCITLGYLDGRVVVVVWTPRGQARRIISMRKANERETAQFERDVG